MSCAHAHAIHLEARAVVDKRPKVSIQIASIEDALKTIMRGLIIHREPHDVAAPPGLPLGHRTGTHAEEALADSIGRRQALVAHLALREPLEALPQLARGVDVSGLV